MTDGFVLQLNDETSLDGLKIQIRIFIAKQLSDKYTTIN